MFCLTKPDPDFIRAFLSGQKGKPYSCEKVGRSRENPPEGFTIDHNRILLGKGMDVFDRAKRAIQEWKMFDMPWISLCWPDTPIAVNGLVAVLIRHLGFWSLNACRIVYVLEEHGAVEKYGFAYGTLQAHAECGEERFTVEYCPEDDSVWYDLYAFSKPQFVAKLGHPLARALQKKFARDSKLAMQQATQRGT
jgi:uncharacterized protein (UPF0548 family)